MRQQTYPSTIGGMRLRALRQSRGHTQLYIELEASLGIGYLQRLEHGKIQQPERDTLERILTALETSSMERRQVLELFGYAPAYTPPTPSEIDWAITVFHRDMQAGDFPAYLLDSEHHLLAWNRLVPHLYTILDHLSAPTKLRIPTLIFDPQYAIAPKIKNAHEFYSAQIGILDYEQQRSGHALMQDALVDELRRLPLFDQYWRHVHRTSIEPVIRPRAHLTLVTDADLMEFRLSAEPYVNDSRFRIIEYLPANHQTLQRCLDWQ